MMSVATIAIKNGLASRAAACIHEVIWRCTTLLECLFYRLLFCGLTPSRSAKHGYTVLARSLATHQALYTDLLVKSRKERIKHDISSLTQGMTLTLTVSSQ